MSITINSEQISTNDNENINICSANNKDIDFKENFSEPKVPLAPKNSFLQGKIGFPTESKANTRNFQKINLIKKHIINPKNSIFSKLDEIKLKTEILDCFFEKKKKEEIKCYLQPITEKSSFPIESKKFIIYCAGFKKLLRYFDNNFCIFKGVLSCLFISDNPNFKLDDRYYELFFNPDFLSSFLQIYPSDSEIACLITLAKEEECLAYRHCTEQLLVFLSQNRIIKNNIWNLLNVIYYSNSTVDCFRKSLELTKCFEFIKESVNLKYLIQLVLEIENYLNRSIGQNKELLEAFDIRTLDSKMEIRSPSSQSSFKTLYELTFEFYSNKILQPYNKEEKYLLSKSELNILSEYAYQDLKELYLQKLKKLDIIELQNSIKNHDLLKRLNDKLAEIHKYLINFHNIELEIKVNLFLEYFSLLSIEDSNEKKIEEVGDVLKIIECICRKFNDMIDKTIIKQEITTKNSKNENLKVQTISRESNYQSQIKKSESYSKFKSSIPLSNSITKKYKI